PHDRAGEEAVARARALAALVRSAVLRDDATLERRSRHATRILSEKSRSEDAGRFEAITSAGPRARLVDFDRFAAAVRLEEPTAELLDDVDYVEVAPETLWRSDERGELVANGFHARFAALKRTTKRATGLPFVAHGVAFSLGSARPDPIRRARWLARIAEDH